MRTALMAGLCVLVALNGCGGSSSTSKTTATTGGNTSGSPLTITGSDPIDTGAGVEVDKALTVTFSAAIDETTLTEANVQLGIAPSSMADMQHSDVPDPSMDTMAQVMGDISYDSAAQQLTFTPMAHLEHGQDYHFILRAIKDEAGAETLATTTVRFRTLNNPSIQRVSYDEATGQVKTTEVYTRDADGNTTRTDVFTGTRAAGVLESYTISADAKLPGPPEVAVRSINYNGADNAIKRYSANISQAGKTVARGSYIAPGADAKWNQTDDLLSSFSEARVSHGNMHWLTNRFSANTNAGAPWSARTTGFKLSRVELREFDEKGQTRRLVTYTSLGANGVVDVDAAGELTVVDDVVRSYELIERNDMGMRVRTLDFGGGQTPPDPGADGVLFTEDDVPIAVEVSTINSGGHRTLQVDYDGAGPDGNWDTVNDNTVEDYDLFTYAAGTDNLTERRRFSGGTNKIMENGRGDDKLKRVTTYDPNV